MAKLVLCKGVELEPNYEHTFDFANATEQGEYFSSKAYKTYDAFLKIKDKNASLFKGIIAKENYDYLKVDDTIDNLRECTYLYWQDDITSKVYYAFITNSYYVNDKCTVVEYELDVMQTFLFDYNIESAYISREHQDRMYYDNEDGKYHPIYNIQPENLNLGKEYYIEDYKKLSAFEDTGQLPLLWLVIVAKEPIFGGLVVEVTSRYDFMKNLYIYVIPFEPSSYGTLTRQVYFQTGTGVPVLITNAEVILEYFIRDEKIHQVFVLPHIPFEDKLTISRTNISGVGSRVLITQSSNIDEQFLSPTTIEGDPNDITILRFNQTPLLGTNRGEIKIGKLNALKTITIIPSTTLTNSIIYETKLYTHPFRKMELQVDNSSTDLYYEFVKNDDMIGIVNIYATSNQIYYNKYYNQNTEEKLSYGLRYNNISKSINDVPFNSDPYLNYMLGKSQQAITGVALGTLSGGATAMLGAGLLSNPATAGIGGAMLVGGVLSAGGSIANEIAKQEDLKNKPDEIVKGGNDGVLGALSYSCVPIINYLSVQEQYLKQAYSYFRLFGYKANRLATPSYSGNTITSDNMNLKSRYYYNYIKCADINIELAYNRDYHDKIVSIFKNGITFWHYRSATMTASTFKPFNYRYENIEVSLLS